MKLDLSIDWHKDKAKSYLKSLIERKSKIEIKRLQAKRSLDQNAYFHVLVQILASDLGYTKDEMKEVIKRLNPSLFAYDKHGATFNKSSKELTKDEFSTLISWMRTEWPYLPDSTTVANNWASLLIELEKTNYYG